jgi:hypothetical protein
MYGHGNVWNGFNVAHHPGTSTDPSMALVDSAGNATAVAFSITGTLSAWNSGGTGPYNDYLFVRAGGADREVDWEISGLISGATYELYAYGGPARNILLTVDNTGQSLSVPTLGALFEDILVGADGKITGTAAGFDVGDPEGNWSGFQLRLTSEPGEVPEPATLAMVTLAAAGLGGYARRRKWRKGGAGTAVVAGLLAVVVTALSPAGASTITHVGNIMDNAGSEVTEWRTATTAKTLDADGDNLYGSDARLFYRVYGNYGTYIQYIGSETQVGPYPGYTVTDHPAGGADLQVRTTTSGGVPPGSLRNMFTFGIAGTPPANGFRVGVAFDGLNGAQYSPQEIRLTQTTGGSATASVVVEPFRNNTIDMAFFDVKGAAVGEQYTVQGVAGPGGFATHQIVTWDSLPAAPPRPIAGGDAIKLDFSNAGDGDGGSLSDWNQTTNAVAAIPAGAVVRHGDASVVSGVGIQFSGGGGGYNNDPGAGNWPGTAADPYYILAADDIYFGPGALTTTFSGLDPSLTYNVRIACLIGNNPGATEMFTVTDGAGTQSLSSLRGARWAAATLEDGNAVFTGLIPNALGEIDVIVQNTAGGNGYYPLNAIVLEAEGEIPEPATMVLLALSAASLAGYVRRRRAA